VIFTGGDASCVVRSGLITRLAWVRKPRKCSPRSSPKSPPPEDSCETGFCRRHQRSAHCLGSALVSTSEELLWAPTDFTRIDANEAKAGRIWIVRAGRAHHDQHDGPALIHRARLGLLISSPTLGVTVVSAQSPRHGHDESRMVASNSRLICRTIGAAGVNSNLFWHTGFVVTQAISPRPERARSTVPFGGTVATADASVPTGVAILQDSHRRRGL